MSTTYSTDYEKAYVNNTLDRVEMGNYNGKMRTLYFDFSKEQGSGASGLLTDGDLILLAKLPKNARVHDVVMSHPADSAGVLDIGYAANGVDNASTNAFIDGAAQTSAATVKMTGAANTAGLFKKFTAETIVQAEVITTFNAASSDVFKGVIYYVVD